MSKHNPSSKPRPAADDAPEAPEAVAAQVAEQAVEAAPVAETNEAPEAVSDPLAAERAELARQRADLEQRADQLDAHEEALRKAAHAIDAERERLNGLGVKVDPPKPEDEAAGTVLVSPQGLRAFSVTIPNCLLGERCLVAKSEEDAYHKYKKLGGINSHNSPRVVRPLPVGSKGFDLAMEAHLADVAKQEAAAKAEAEAPK